MIRNIYPKGALPKLDRANIEVWHHDSLMAAVHNMPCATCHGEKAVLFLNDGRFHPCDKCSQKGWVTLKLSPFWRRFLQMAGVLR